MTERGIIYSPDKAPEVEVLVDGQWCFGALREWRKREDRWEGTVSYNTGPGSNWLKQFDQDLIRPLRMPGKKPYDFHHRAMNTTFDKFIDDLLR